MKLGGLGAAGRDLRSLLEGGSTADLSDGELLARFIKGRGNAPAEAAFAVLVSRHGPMVWGTCRRIARDPHVAEDAFQATFLVLVKKAGAGSIRVEDSLGRWLHGVAVRVALRARAGKSHRVARDLTTVEAVTSPPEIAEIRAVIDEEVERLPSNYRSVVVLCHLEGLTRENAATRLRCPVGTVNSRLSRASEILRTRLTRRGLAPATGGLAVWLAGESASASVPASLAGLTVSTALRVVSAVSLTGLVPVGVSLLVQVTLRRMGMLTLTKLVAVGTSVIGLGVLGYAAVGQGSAGLQTKPQITAQTSQGSVNTIRPQTPAERLQEIQASYDEATETRRAAIIEAVNKVSPLSPTEKDEMARKMTLNPEPWLRQCLELADRAPKDLGSRDALEWAARTGYGYLFHIGSSDSTSTIARLSREAVEKLLQHHPSDGLSAHAAFNLGNRQGSEGEAVVRMFFERAEGREAKGIATLALAEFLNAKSERVGWAKTYEIQPNARLGTRDDKGRRITIERTFKPVDDAYYQHLRASDPETIRKEADELYRRVIDQYADIPYNRPPAQEQSKKMGKPIRTIGQVAEAHFNLVVGQVAPRVQGFDLDNKPLHLGDFSGKVVLLIFWNSSSPASMALVPEELALAERFAGKPFAVLGVNSDGDMDIARKAAKDSGMTWPSWPERFALVSRRYLINAYPSFVLIDAKGIVRSKPQTVLTDLGREIDELLAEIKDPK